MKEHSRPCCVLTTKIITTKWTNPTEGQHHSSQSGRTQPGSNLYNSRKWTDPSKVKLISPQSERIPPRVNTTVHKVDGPNQGQTYKSTKWTDPTKGQHGSQSGRTQPGSNLYKSKKWTDPTRVRLIQLRKEDGPYHWSTSVHKMDGPYQRFKTPIHIMDGPNQFIKLYKSTKWTAIRGHDHIPRNGRTQPGSQTL